MPTKIILADDHAMFREMLLHVLSYKGERYKYVVMAEAADGENALAQVSRYLPDILVLDYKMPGVGRLSVFCKEMARRSPTTKILVLTGYSEEGIALEAALGGAKGYVVKGASVDSLLNAIATVEMGGTWVDPGLPPTVIRAFLGRKGKKLEKIEKLSRREMEVLSRVVQRMTNAQVSSHLHIDKRTVKNHLMHVFRKLGVTSRQEATAQFVGAKPPAKQPRVAKIRAS
jgi:DNA-binding NarL/FixJ family response regulator